MSRNADLKKAILDEKRRARQLKTIVDFTTHLIAQQPMSREEAESLVAATRRRALELFPDKANVFDLVIAPRFARLIDEFVGAKHDPASCLPLARGVH
jgi:hypothetical protein